MKGTISQTLIGLVMAINDWTVVQGWLAPTTCGSFGATYAKSSFLMGIPADLQDGEPWVDLTSDGGVYKKIVSPSPDATEPYPDGTDATISYKGTVAASDWTADEVVKCWLAEQQGYQDDKELQAAFVENDVDEASLTNLDSFFTEAFVQDTLGVTAKIPCKKLVMAAKRLATSRSDFPTGTEFDSQEDFSITVGPTGSKLISGMTLGIASMTPGETAILRIRSDYGYGGEGYRKRNGDVMVPPFATLQFQIQLN